MWRSALSSNCGCQRPDQKLIGARELEAVEKKCNGKNAESQGGKSEAPSPCQFRRQQHRLMRQRGKAITKRRMRTVLLGHGSRIAEQPIIFPFLSVPAPTPPGYPPAHREPPVPAFAARIHRSRPTLHRPALRAVRISTCESPTITVSSGAAPASRISVLAPSGSGFLVSKLLPPYTWKKWLPRPRPGEDVARSLHRLVGQHGQLARDAVAICQSAAAPA